MASFDQEHLPFNKGWRWKVQKGDDAPVTLSPGEEYEIFKMDLEEEDVLAGFLMFWTVSAQGSNGGSLSVDTQQEIPGPSGESVRQSGPINIGNQLNIGNNTAVGGLPWAEHTVVDGVDVFSLNYNGFGGIPVEVRFPEVSSVIAVNEGDSDVTMSSFRAGAQLIHLPKLFFKQVRAYNILTGQVPEDRYDIDEERQEKYIEALDAISFEGTPDVSVESQ